MRDLRRFAAWLVLAAVPALPAAPAVAQAQPPQAAAPATAIVTRATGAITAAHPMRILAAPLAGCVLVPQACSQFEADLRAALAARGEAAPFIERDALTAALKQRGFLSIDANDDAVLKSVAPDTGADVLVTEDILWRSSYYELHATVEALAAHGKPATFKNRLATSLPGPSGQPILLNDPETGAAMVVWNGDRKKAPLFQYPKCNVCSEPLYPLSLRLRKREGVVILQASITETGSAEDLATVETFDDDATASALQAAHLWDFKPATGIDGKPFKVRIRLRVAFRLG
jgi:TonB family protein